MGNPDVKLIFGVAGNGGLGGASGKEIKGRLQELVKNLEKNQIPKIKIFFDDKSIQKEIDRIKKKFKSVLNFDVNSNTKNTTGSTNKKAKTTNANEQSNSYDEIIKKIKQSEKAELEVYKNAKRAGTEYYQALKKEANKYQEELNKMLEQMNGLSKAQKDDIDFQVYKSDAKKEVMFDSEETKAALKFGQVLDRLGTYFHNTKVKTREGREELEKLKTLMKKDLMGVKENGEEVPWESATDIEKLIGYTKRTDKLIETLREVQANLNKTGAIGESVWTKLGKAITNHAFEKAALLVLTTATRAIHQVYQNVVELDKAVTNLQIATGKTREETKELITTYANLAQQLGATVTEVTEAADTWLRQGYSVAETNELITYTMMLSKLGQLDSAEAAKALTSAMKGYKVSVEDAMDIVDKFTAVDMEAAISAGDIATAMAETATSADIAGVSMDKLIGYIATVGEVTQDGAESIGTFYKTMFARMGSISAGNFTDAETGESFNDVEIVLNRLGISLRAQNGEFKNFSDVLDEVAEDWENYSNVQQHAIATAFAGKLVPVRTEMCA